MQPEAVFKRYQDLQQYVGWTDDDCRRVVAAGAVVAEQFVAMVDDFYSEIERHPQAQAVITGGAPQIERLKGTLRQWLEELFAGQYDEAYVGWRWQVGLRHVEIGLYQVYTNAALSRLRWQILAALQQLWPGDADELLAIYSSLNKLIDLDLAIIEDAYQDEYMRRREQAERLATIGQVAGGVAHELRNPLNVVKTSVYFLRNARQLTPEKQLEHLDRIERQVGLADKVITALSDFAKLPLPLMQPVDVAELVQEVLAERALPESVALELSLPGDLPPALGDARQLAIALSNLVRNALDAMPEGGALSIASAQVGRDIELAVRDTGVGIPEEQLRRILDPLYSTKVKGIGLGLSIVRAILDKHGAEIRISSTPGQGSSFVIRLAAGEPTGDRADA